MKEELIFRYNGNKEGFLPLQEELEGLGIKVLYIERRCNEERLEGLLQYDADTAGLINMIRQRAGYLQDKGLILEDTVRKHAL